MSKIAPALAAGCTVVLKPSELTPSPRCVWPRSLSRSASRVACSTLCRVWNVWPDRPWQTTPVPIRSRSLDRRP
ncbi:aldehyde dehydrogenase family protein [Arthrobacter sp. SDTb3-6]|uniref:aldehyde dehydrogenase family protein n=1 Tax=Arthrobacter sp. SDTb3-6 TaxID=2713571 RepID=UPI00159D7CBD|nr:aldehyde dehydrogenase family protein [Arthrobacter sp. SDTb3-6]